MKRLYLGMGVAALAIGGVAISASSAQEPVLVVSEADLATDESLGLRTFNGQPFTGEVRAYFPDGKVASVEQYKDGLRDGRDRLWFPNGTLGFEASFVGGVSNGPTRSWWINGNKRSQSSYVDGKEDGAHWEWYMTGEKFKRYYFEHGEPVGLQQGWRRNGALFSNFEIRGGRLYGLNNAMICYGISDEQIIDPPASGNMQ